VDAVNVALLEQARDQLVFVKELAFQGEPYVSDALIAQATHLFILREPTTVYASLIKLKPDFTEDEFGFTALMSAFRRVQLYQTSISVFDGSVFRDNTKAALRHACNAIGIGFNTKMLRWENGYIRRWLPHERDSQSKWHTTLEASRGII